MPEPLVAAVILAITVALGSAPVRVGFAVLVAAVFLVPDSLILPFAPTGYLNAQRMFLGAYTYRLLVGLRRGEHTAEAFRATPMHVALVAFAAVTYVVGVLFARSPVQPDEAFNDWLLVADQVVFFAVVVAAVRIIGDPIAAAKALVLAAAAAALVAVGEHVTLESYSLRVWFVDLPEQAGFPGARPIELRGGDVRARAAASFALAFAWIAGSVVPLALALAAWERRRWLLAPPLLVVAVLWTYSRSVLAGIALGAVVLLVGSRFQGRATRVVVAGAVVAAVALAGSSLLGRTFEERAATGSDTVRVERLPVVLEAAADRPVFGAGYGTVRRLGFSGTDAAYVGTYVELGVVGVIALGLVLATALWVTLAALRSPIGRDRAVAAAAAAGVVMAILGAGAFDLFPNTQSSRPFWLLVAAALVLAEHNGTTWSLRLPARRAFAGAAVGLGAGVAIAVAAPRTDTATYRFQSLGVASDARAEVPRDFIGRVRFRAACDAAEAVAGEGGATVDCAPVPGTSDLAELRVEVDEGGALDDAVRRVQVVVEQVADEPDLTEVSAVDGARPAWASTATVWAPVAAAFVALGLPLRRRPAGRRSR